MSNVAFMGLRFLPGAHAALIVLSTGHSFLACPWGNRREALLSPHSSCFPWQQDGKGEVKVGKPVPTEAGGVEPAGKIGLGKENGREQLSGKRVIIWAHRAMAMQCSCGSRTLPRLEAWCQVLWGCFHYGCPQEAESLIPSAALLYHLPRHDGEIGQHVVHYIFLLVLED